MDDEWVKGLIASLRGRGAEDTAVEAKRAAEKLPRNVVETLSSFANTPGGGVLLLGVDESLGYAVTGVTGADKVQHDLAEMARGQLTPSLQPVISTRIIEGHAIVIAEVTELPREQKPCYVTARGMSTGSYIRVADGDRRLTSQEVQQLLADRGQPRFDQEIVSEASVADLDTVGVERLLARVRSAKPYLFGERSNEDVLTMLSVIRSDEDGVPRPTMAGLLALGSYPQQYFPQLCLTFVHYPTSSGEQVRETRFLDNVRIDGSIPVMMDEALRVIKRNMTRRAQITAQGRMDVWEYPPEALREAVVNAMVHRDLSPGSRGSQVQVEMYPDRLRIMNPGGLYGAVYISRFGVDGVSSARNSHLLRILEDVPTSPDGRTICENRGSGIRTMRSVLSRAGMAPPVFHDKVTSFEVRMPNYTLMDEGTVEWLGTLGAGGLKDAQRTALALMRRGRVLDNAGYRTGTGVQDSRTATSELQDLVARELITQTGTRGGARYSLSEYARSLASSGGGKRARPNRRHQILGVLVTHRELSKTEISSILHINPKTAEHWIRILKREGAVEPTEPGRGKGVKYRLPSTR